MKRFILVDLNDTEKFSSEAEARERLEDWIEYVRQARNEARADADPEKIARWDAEEDFYSQCDDIAGQIRLYAIDLDVYEGDPDAFPEETLHGCERLETFNYCQLRSE